MAKIKTFLHPDERYQYFPKGMFDSLVLLMCEFLKRSVTSGFIYGNDSDTFEGTGNIEVDDSYPSKMLVAYYECSCCGYDPAYTEYYVDFITVRALKDDSLSEKEIAEILIAKKYIELMICFSRDSIQRIGGLSNHLGSYAINNKIETIMAEVNSNYLGS